MGPFPKKKISCASHVLLTDVRLCYRYSEIQRLESSIGCVVFGDFSGISYGPCTNGRPEHTFLYRRFLSTGKVPPSLRLRRRCLRHTANVFHLAHTRYLIALALNELVYRASCCAVMVGGIVSRCANCFIYSGSSPLTDSIANRERHKTPRQHHWINKLIEGVHNTMSMSVSEFLGSTGSPLKYQADMGSLMEGK
jgi:hypothetical protein